MAPGIYVHTFFVTSGGNLVLCTCCKARLVSSGVWRGKREHLSVSDTQDLDTTPLCAGTQALVLGHQVCTAPGRLAGVTMGFKKVSIGWS